MTSLQDSRTEWPKKTLQKQSSELAISKTTMLTLLTKNLDFVNESE